ncbi:MAG: LON peptidase substrate-binding domain-containing protein [Armatimonadota bacterium]
MRIPLMPLNSVLYPWMPLVLSVYEERYLRMLEEVLRGPQFFGTALIAEGREVGGPAVPHAVGTEVIIARAWPVEDGSWRVVGIGRHRFRVLSMVTQEPYPVAEVDYAGLGESCEEEVSEELLARVRRLFEEHLELLLILLGQPGMTPSIPEDAARLSYMVAAHLGTGTLERQRLLEIPGARERLETEVGLLRQDLARLRLFAAATPSRPERADLN